MKQLLKQTKGDQVIWAVVIILSFISLLAVYSATGSLAYKHDTNANYYLVKQVVILGLGLIFIYFIHRVNYTKFAKLAVLFYLISIPLLIYTLFFGVKLNEGSRWISLPGTGITIQTSALAQLALFMFLARMLSIKQAVIKDFKKRVPARAGTRADYSSAHCTCQPFYSSNDWYHLLHTVLYRPCACKAYRVVGFCRHYRWVVIVWCFKSYRLWPSGNLGETYS